MINRMEHLLTILAVSESFLTEVSNRLLERAGLLFCGPIRAPDPIPLDFLYGFF